MMWLSPKTNWSHRDYYNVEDYNRLVDDVNFLHEQAQKIYKKEFTIYNLKKILPNLDHYYPSMINQVIASMNIIANETYVPLNYYNVGIVQDNFAVPNYINLNRIETNLVGLYSSTIGVESCKEKCGFALIGLTGL